MTIKQALNQLFQTKRTLTGFVEDKAFYRYHNLQHKVRSGKIYSYETAKKVLEENGYTVKETVTKNK